MWIYEDTSWPNFVWSDSKISTALAEVRYLQGCLIGKMQSIGFELKQEASLDILTDDAIKTSAIEGEQLDQQQVRSSVAKHLGILIDKPTIISQNVDAIVDVLIDATQQYHQPLTRERLFAWHNTLFPSGRSGMHAIVVGDWRDDSSGPMQVVSGPIGKETVHFQAPRAETLESEMASFFTWYESGNNIDPVLKAGIAHLWFVTIHPFEDGNGRIGRAIADMTLSRAENISRRFYSLSTQIDIERENYYQALEKQQSGNVDITDWLIWFLSCLSRAINNSQIKLKHVLFKAKLWEKINLYDINDRQRIIINRMLAPDFKGYMNTSKYAKIAKCSTDTALRDIKQLLAREILSLNQAKGRSTSYRLNASDLE